MYLLHKRTGSREDAEDLTQQALMRAYEKIDQYDPGRSFRAWLFTIAVRLAIDAHRKDRVGATANGIDHVADTAPSPAERIYQKDTQRHLWALADRVLDPTQRTALWLHYGEQLKAGQIGLALGVSAVHVRVLLFRARRTLMAHLDRPEPVRMAPTRVVKPVFKPARPCQKTNVKEGAIS